MASGLVLGFLSMSILVSAKAQNETSTNGTPKSVGWIPTTPGRNTMNVIWSCFSILLVCSLKCVHLNISSFEENKAGWPKSCGIPYWTEWPPVRKALRRLKWMTIIVVAPELGVTIAAKEYSDSKELRKIVQDEWPAENLSLSHAFYAKMGGFAVVS